MNTFPLTYTLLLKMLLPKGKLKILDLGCGTGAVGEILNHNKDHLITGVDIFPSYVKTAQNSGFYNDVKRVDINKYPIKKNEYDVIVGLQVIEHLKKNNAISLIKNAFSKAKKAVIISIPNGECRQEEYDKNPYQKHQSEWTVGELRSLGFSVHGQGLKFVYGGESYAKTNKIALWQKISFIFSFILTPVIFYIPSLGAQLICVKYTK